MLQTFDTIIAFAVIMTVLSLVITIIVQMCSAAFALRGKNLANGLALTFQTIDPKVGAHAHALAAHILKDPIFSDSLFASKQKPEMRIPDNLLPIIAAERALRKAVAALTAAPQDQNLRTAVTEAEQTLAAARQQRPELSNPPIERQKPWGFISKGAMHLGSAIRPSEIYRILQDWGALTTTEATVHGIPPELAKKSRDLLVALHQPDRPAAEAAGKLTALSQVANLFGTPEEKQAVVNALAHLGTTVERATTRAYDRFQRWFGSAQDRAEQWFQMHIRGITIAASGLIAFVLQLDTIDMFRQLRSQPEVVAALIKNVAPVVIEQGKGVVDPSDTPAYQAYRVWLLRHPLYPLDASPPNGPYEGYVAALKSRLAQSPASPESSQPVADFLVSADHELTPIPAGDSQAREAALFSVYQRWATTFPLFRLEPEPKRGDTADTVAKQIAEKIQKVHDERLGSESTTQQRARDLWLAEYESLFASGRPFLDARRRTVDTLRGALESTGFSILPKRFMGRWAEEPPRWGWKCQSLARFWAHFFGMFITAGLLTLGAPFWFNLLKNLTSLRPAVATLVERRPQSASANAPPSN